MSHSIPRDFNGELVVPVGMCPARPAVFGEPGLVTSSWYACPLPRPRKPMLPRWMKPRLPDPLPPRPPWLPCSDGGLLTLRSCFLNVEGTWLGDSLCMRENFKPFRSLSILVANETSCRLGNNFWVGSQIVVLMLQSYVPFLYWLLQFLLQY